MPTGYTAPFYEGKEIDFETFVLRCSRAMGATIMLRDYDTDVLPTEENVVEPEGYFEGALSKAKETLCTFDGISNEELERLTAEYNLGVAASRSQDLLKNARIRNAYEEMLARVRAWEPPEDYESLKSFIIEQLESSLHHDVADDDFVSKWYKTYTPEEYRAFKVKQAARDITHYTEELEKKRERNEQRVKYVRGLREALGLEVRA